jgi:hypothetical protein
MHPEAGVKGGIIGEKNKGYPYSAKNGNDAKNGW